MDPRIPSDVGREISDIQRRLSVLERMPKLGSRQEQLAATSSRPQVSDDTMQAGDWKLVGHVGVFQLNKPVMVVDVRLGTLMYPPPSGSSFKAQYRLKATYLGTTRYTQPATWTQDAGYDGVLYRWEWLHPFPLGWQADSDAHLVEVQVKNVTAATLCAPGFGTPFSVVTGSRQDYPDASENPAPKVIS
ncbi:hypothetical protein O1L55_20760 [Streptomyces albulus]|nr:hypothetical protein [Streptomyces noursei]